MKTKNGTLVFALALLLVAAAPLVAGGDDAKEHWAKLKQELTLTDAQVIQLQQKLDALRTGPQSFDLRARGLKGEMEQLEKAAAPDAKAISAKRAEFASLKAEWKEKAMQIFQSVLTREQFAKFQELEAAREKKEMKEYSEKKKQN